MLTLDTIKCGDNIFITNIKGIRKAHVEAVQYSFNKNSYLIRDNKVSRKITIYNEELSKQTVSIEGESYCATPYQAAAATLYYRMK